MASHDQSSFQPSLPARTSTVDSQTSMGSPPVSPTSRSPTEDSFFGAITARMRRTRSRSRSRVAASRARSKSPMAMPPERIPQSANTHARNNSLPQRAGHAASASTTAPPAAAAKPARPSLQGDGRTMSGSDPWRGRHSNSWLFNDFSVTGTAKNFLERRKS